MQFKTPDIYFSPVKGTYFVKNDDGSVLIIKMKKDINPYNVSWQEALAHVESSVILSPYSWVATIVAMADNTLSEITLKELFRAHGLEPLELLEKAQIVAEGYQKP